MEAGAIRDERSTIVRLLRGLLVLGIVAACGGTLGAQSPGAEELPAAQVDEGPQVSEEQAIATARRFANAAGMPRGDGRAMAVLQPAGGGGPAHWHVALVSGQATAARFRVDAAEGHVYYAQDEGAEARHTQNVKLSPEEAVARATRLMELMEVDRRSLALRDLELVWDRETNGQHWRVEWERLLNGDRVGGFGLVVLSAESGALCRATRQWWPPKWIGVRMSRQEAIDRALEIGGELLGTDQLALDGAPALIQVSPNDHFGTRGPDEPIPSTVRTAWWASVTPRSGHARRSGMSTILYIDAADGRLLGGDGYRPESVAAEEPPPRRVVFAEELPAYERGSEARAVEESRSATRYLVAAIAGGAALLALIVLVLLWPKQEAGAQSEE